MVFHLDKCIGCHTCSLACKNIWTDRQGTEYMWWNNVETKPGTGYPTLWEDQEKYKGGWEIAAQERSSKLRLRLQSRLGALGNLFFNPYLPTLDDYYGRPAHRRAHLDDQRCADRDRIGTQLGRRPERFAPLCC
jgi:nitrate reductase beta subunit